MTRTNLGSLAAIDYVVVAIPDGVGPVSAETVGKLLEGIDDPAIRIVNVVIVEKHSDGTVDATEVEDVAWLGPLETIQAELVAEEAVMHIAPALEPGTTVGVIAYENPWPATFASTVRRSGGHLVGSGRIPIPGSMPPWQSM